MRQFTYYGSFMVESSNSLKNSVASHLHSSIFFILVLANQNEWPWNRPSITVLYNMMGRRPSAPQMDPRLLTWEWQCVSVGCAPGYTRPGNWHRSHPQRQCPGLQSWPGGSCCRGRWAWHWGHSCGCMRSAAGTGQTPHCLGTHQPLKSMALLSRGC